MHREIYRQSYKRKSPFRPAQLGLSIGLLRRRSLQSDISLGPIGNKSRKRQLTLNFSNALLQNLLEGLGVLELLGDLGDDGLGELPLLALLDLALVPDPRVQDGLGLGGDGSLLLELKGLGLELGGFLSSPVSIRHSRPLVAVCRQQ